MMNVNYFENLILYYGEKKNIINVYINTKVTKKLNMGAMIHL